MGLSSLTINADLATTWRRILEENGLKIWQDDAKVGQCEETHTTVHVSEVIWRVENGSHELQVLEATYHDRQDGNVRLVFMPPKTQCERQLFLLVQELLIASGATVGATKKSVN